VCLTSCYLINRLPTPLLKNKSPFQLLFNRTPYYTFLKILGVHASLIFAPITHKFSLCSKQWVFLGYSPNHKSCKCYHAKSSRMYISRDVVFHETMFPFATTSSLTKSYAAQPALFIPPLHTLAHTPTRPTTPPVASNITPLPTSSHSFSAEPSVTHSHSSTHAPRTHPMCTRA
jgi:hypothetical protein